MKADLFVYGLIGLQDHWRNVQGYADENIALNIVRAARHKELDVIALTSMHDGEVIPKGSIHDRFTQFGIELSQDNHYEFKLAGDNLLIVQPRVKNGDSKPLYVLNAQKVITLDTENKGQRADLLVVGNNNFENYQATGQLLADTKKRRCLTIATSDVPITTTQRYAFDLDAAAHNGHAHWLLSSANRRSKPAARECGIPWIAVSGTKVPENVGSAYTEFTEPYNFREDWPQDWQLLACMGKEMKRHKFKAHTGYESVFDAFATELRFKLDTRPNVRKALGV